MILDKQMLSFDEYSLARPAATYVGDAYDLWGSAAQAIAGRSGLGNTDVIRGNEDISQGNEIFPFAYLDEAMTSGGAATLQMLLVSADDAGLVTNPVTVWDSGAIALATLVAGYQFAAPHFKYGDCAGKRYVGWKAVIGTATGTAGAVTAGLKTDREHRGEVY